MQIEFDAAKRDLTLATRGLDMAHCEAIFAGPTLKVADLREDYGEPRNITIGFLDERMVVVVSTPRAAAHRIISLRKANDREQAIYAPRFAL